MFKWSEVNIPAGVTVKFINHPSRAPVVWLVQGNVTNLGTINLAGASGVSGPGGLVPAEPGPGGFRGGATGPSGSGAGLGPGGGVGGNSDGRYSGIYGRPQILPLIGGSGGNGGTQGGGGGGGAILIAAAGTLVNGGLIFAQGGAGGPYGSGGAVKLIANEVLGAGLIDCRGGGDWVQAPGRIRIETPTVDGALRTTPETIAVAPATPPVIWPPDTSPKVHIVSIDSATENVPTEPTAPLTGTADVAMQSNLPSLIRLRTENFPLEGIVQVRVAHKWSPYVSWVRAHYESGNEAEAFWRVTNGFSVGYSTLQARATAP